MTLKEFFEKTKHLDPETEICIANWNQTGGLYLEDFTEEMDYEVFFPYKNRIYTDSDIDLLDRVNFSKEVNLMTLTFTYP